MSVAGGLELVLFSTRPEEIVPALGAGIGSVIVDWEWRDKENRQRGADTEINRDGPEDLAHLWAHLHLLVAVGAGSLGRRARAAAVVGFSALVGLGALAAVRRASSDPPPLYPCCEGARIEA